MGDYAEYNVSGFDKDKLTSAIGVTDDIMEGYRDFGADNPYLNQSYGQDNPYMDSAIGGIKNLENMSNQTGPTKYASALLDSQNMTNQMQTEDLTKGYSSDTATAYSNLAQAGGLDSGARERIASNSVGGLMQARQRQSAQDAMARGNIMSNDAGYKQDLAKNIPGMYNPYALGQEAWTQNKGLAMEDYYGKKQDQRLATIGNIYGGNND